MRKRRGSIRHDFLGLGVLTINYEYLNEKGTYFQPPCVDCDIISVENEQGKELTQEEMEMLDFEKIVSLCIDNLP